MATSIIAKFETIYIDLITIYIYTAITYSTFIFLCVTLCYTRYVNVLTRVIYTYIYVTTVACNITVL